MILEFSNNQYIDIDEIKALRWLEDVGAGVIVLPGEKIAVKNREHFDAIEAAFIYLHKSHMYDKKMKDIRFVKKEG